MSATDVLVLKAASGASPAVNTEPEAYERLGLVVLTGLICKGDRKAMEEVFTRRKLMRLDGRRVTPYTWILSRVDHPGPGWRGGDLILEAAQDLLLDRFSRMPEEPDGGTDCRNYYRAFLDHLPGEMVEVNGQRSIRDHNAILQRIEGFVRRHWRLCLKEAWRREQCRLCAHDYYTDDGCVRLYVPVSVPAAARDAWLERTAGPIDAGDAGRVQARIDAWLDRELLERERRLRAEVVHDPFGSGLSPFVLEHGWSHDGLARTVAREKAGAPGRLRRSIAALGSERIGQLITRIFSDASAGCYHPSSVARDFGLHKSVLTRFAAANWQPGDDGPVPDLWLNTAQVLGSQPRFRAALDEAGLHHHIRRLVDPRCEDLDPQHPGAA